LFCNLSQINLQNTRPLLQNLYARYLSSPEFVNDTHPIGYTSTMIPSAVTCVSPVNSDSIAWSFPLAKLFDYTHVSKDIPVCQYYTHQSLDDSVPVIISSKYKYANVIPGNHMCSHPSVSQNPYSCSFFTFFSNCSMYSPSQQEILFKTVTSPNSSSTLDFVLTYSLTSSGNHMFVLTNQTIGEDVNVLVYPQTYSYDKCLEEATSIYNQYIEPYSSTLCVISENQKISSSDSTKYVEKESYITSLLVG